ncbi:MAG: glycosyltransferase [bacterium]
MESISHILFYLFHLFSSVSHQFRDALFQISARTLYQQFLLFWPALLLDIPRSLTACSWGIVTAERFKTVSSGDFPGVSVLIPGYNEEETIGYTIESLLNGHYPNLEIVVVDDGSDDRMEEVCRPYARSGRIIYSRNRVRSGKSASLNHAFSLASGEFTVMMDADSVFDPQAIREIIRPFNNPKVGAVAGNLRLANADRSFWTRLQDYEYAFTIGIGRRLLFSARTLSIVSGAFGAFRSDLLRKVGGWEVGPGEDADLTLKIRKSGYRIAFAPRALCYTVAPAALTGLFRQRLRWNRSLVRVRLRKHRDILFPGRFSFFALAGLAESFFFQVVFLYARIPYFWSLASEGKLLLPIFIINFLLYFGLHIIQFLTILLISENRRRDCRLIRAVIPAFIYHFMLGIVRGYAYINELAFRSSYRDSFVPARVRKKLSKY